MLNLLLLVCISLLWKKTSLSVIYIFSTISFKLNYQFNLLVLILVISGNINWIIVVLIRLCTTFKFKLFYKLLNKSLMYSKTAPYHIIVFLLTILWIITTTLKTKHNGYIALILTAITILLGVFWSMQEVLWGGLWNWNLIELTIFFLLLTLFSITHHRRSIICKPNSILIIIFIYLYFNHVPLVLSNHNFTNNKFLKTTLTLLPLLCLYKVKSLITVMLFYLIWLSPKFIELTALNEVDYLTFVKILTLTFILNYTNTKTRYNLLIMLINSVYWVYIIKLNWFFLRYNNSYVNLIHKLILLVVLSCLLLQTHYLVYYKSSYLLKPICRVNYSTKHIIYFNKLFSYNKTTLSVKNKLSFTFINRKTLVTF